jgi:hypothetical protein
MDGRHVWGGGANPFWLGISWAHWQQQTLLHDCVRIAKPSSNPVNAQGLTQASARQGACLQLERVGDRVFGDCQAVSFVFNRYAAALTGFR